jgi:hypothetical protein
VVPVPANNNLVACGKPGVESSEEVLNESCAGCSIVVGLVEAFDMLCVD